MTKLISLISVLLLSLLPLQVSAHNAPCERFFMPKETRFGVTVLTESEMAAQLGTAVRRYRLLGGELFWMEKKLRGEYASSVDYETFETKRKLLAGLGRTLRLAEQLNLAQLTRGQINAIEAAIEDYSRYEFPGEVLEPDTLRQPDEDFFESP